VWVLSVSRLVIVICWLLLGLAWIVSGFFTKRTVKRARRARLPSTLDRVLLAVVVAVALIATKYGGTLWTPSPLVGGLLAGIVAIGLIFTLWARARIGRTWSAAVVLKEDHELIRTGPYAIVRHPIYTGFIVMALGTALDAGAAAGLALVGALSVGLWVKSRREDELMAASFPVEYPEYKRHVRAFIPYVL
jgi:protein-S-isoprenylcysteine O-methyltransferase Ste14